MNKKITYSVIILIIIIAIIIFVVGKKEKNIESEVNIKELFEESYEEAEKIMEDMTIEEKIGQMFLIHYPSSDAEQIVEEYKLGGYIFFEKDFKGKNETEVKEMINAVQEKSKLPLLIAVDEEGGKVVRVSSNENLRSEKFKSPAELYKEGGFEKIAEDTKEKSRLLSNLGINVNLAPVVDISTNSSDYIYERTLGENAELTAEYAKTVINASKEGKVSYTLKHFPGYGSNLDTHTGSSIDNRTYQEIVEESMKPFKAGISAGAEAIMVSHNIVTSIDSENPASLSKRMNEILRNELGFSGIIMTDDLDMKALNEHDDTVVKAVLAGNDLIIVSDYQKSIVSVKEAVGNGTLGTDIIEKAVRRILAWKITKGII